jgi:Stress responsive A/B Barrel Domain
MTIRHLVLFRLHEDVTPDDPRVHEAVAGSAALRTSVPGGQRWRIGPDLSGRDVAAHFAGAGDFASMAALAGFLTHPLHQAAARRWATIATWTIADIEWPGSEPD